MNWVVKKIKKILNITTMQQEYQHEQKAGLFIPEKQASWLLSALLGCCLTLLFVGYWLGYRSALRTFLITTQEESFADTINYSLYTMNDLEVGEFETKEEETVAAETTDQSDESDDQVEQAVGATTVQEEPESSACQSVAQVVQEIPVTAAKVTKVYVAPLAGFGTLQAAQTFVKKIQSIDPYVMVKKRISKTARGKTVAWYQAITGEFDNEQKLQEVLNLLKQKEHLKDVKIIEKRKVVSS